MKIGDLERIAFRARFDLYSKNIDYYELGKLYLEYNPVEDIESFIKKAKEMFPKLNCGLASVYLKKLIPQGKVVKGKYGKDSHTFLLVDNLVVDITADQYGGPEVYVGLVKSPWSIN